MAKLESYYGLCPLLDQISLLGISPDRQPGQALVTLGKNIAIKYKLSNQKQLMSWRTKDKFTSAVIYYQKEEKYCAAFNKMFIKLWRDQDEQLDKHKKIKFKQPIHSLFNCGVDSFILFENGAVIPLDKALEDRRELVIKDVLKKNEKILNVLFTSNKDYMFMGLLLECNNPEKHPEFLYNVFNESVDKMSRILLERRGVSLSGCAVTTCNIQGTVLLTLWSDGKLFSHSLTGGHEESFVTVLDSISCKDSVTIIPLNEDYLAIYGADNSQEGALIVIYNIQFKVTQCKQPFKMYTSGTRIWCLDNTLFICVGLNLAVIPYHLHSEQLAALVGSHKAKINDPDIAIVQELVSVKWDKAKKYKNKKLVPNDQIQVLAEQGWPESAIIEEVLPKYIEDNDLESIKLCLEYFQDTPEQYHVKLLNYLLSLDSKCFNVKVTNDKLPDSLAPMERCYLMDKILMSPYSSIVLLPQLRMHLTLNNSLLLLRYICYLLSEDGHIIGRDVPQDERKLVDWGCVLLDANYQKFLLTKDKKIIEILNYFHGIVKASICCLEEVQQLAPIVASIKSRKYQKNKHAQHVKYSIEEISLY